MSEDTRIGFPPPTWPPQPSPAATEAPAPALGVPTLAPRLPSLAPRIAVVPPAPADPVAASVVRPPVLRPAAISAEPIPVRRGSRLGRLMVALVVVAGAGATYIVLSSDKDARSSSDVAARPDVGLDGRPAATPTTVGLEPVPGAPAAGVLPDLTFTRPAYRSASFTDTILSVRLEAGSTERQSVAADLEVDYVSQIAQLTLASTSPDGDRSGRMIMTETSSYTPGPTDADPWVRKDRTRGPTAMDNVSAIDMYQDAITPAVRAAATNVSVVDEVLGDVPVTTYSFDAPVEVFAESPIDPDVIAFANPALLTVRVTISVDAAGLVRVYDMKFDEAAWIAALPAMGSDASTEVHTRREVTSISDVPSTLTIPPSIEVAEPAGGLSAEACAADLLTLQTASEAWLALHDGSIAPTEAALVSEGLLRMESSGFDFDASGAITPVPGGPCS